MIRTEREARDQFEISLRKAMSGQAIPVCNTGLDGDVTQALLNVAQAWPNHPTGLIATAKTELENQFNGVHAAQQAETRRAIFARVVQNRSRRA